MPISPEPNKHKLSSKAVLKNFKCTDDIYLCYPMIKKSYKYGKIGFRKHISGDQINAKDTICFWAYLLYTERRFEIVQLQSPLSY